MADVTYTSKAWIRHEWRLPSPTNPAEMGKAYAAAQWQAQDLGVPTEYDDWLTIQSTDEAIILWFDVSAAPK